MKFAEEKKIIGNKHFQAKNYKIALRFYSEAIAIFRNPIYFGNRAACHFLLENYTAGLEDAQHAVRLDESYVKGYLRVLRCSLALGDVDVAERAIRRLHELNVNSSIIKNDIEKCEQLRMSVNAPPSLWTGFPGLNLASWALKMSPACLKFKMLKAKCLVKIGLLKAANELAVSCLQVSPQNVDANYVQGIFIFYNEDFEKGLTQFQKVMTLDPKNVDAQAMCTKAIDLKAKKAKGNELFSFGEFRQAYNIYTEALAIDPKLLSFNSCLYYNKALANSKFGDVWDTITDCSEALKANPNYIKPLLMLGRCHSEIRNYEEAVENYKLAHKLCNTVEIGRLLNEAVEVLRKSKLAPKDFYMVLGVLGNATQAEIKKAYHKKAMIHHPDRHSKASADMKRKQEIRFKEVDEAYRVLSDKAKRDAYDKSHSKQSG